MSTLSTLVRILERFPASEPIDSDSEDDEISGPNFTDQNDRTNHLIEFKPLLAACIEGANGEDHTDLTAVLEKLGDISREEIWRIPLGESGILELNSLLLKSHREQMGCIKQVLRLVGNCCADTDVNRQRIVENGTIGTLNLYLQESPSPTSLHYLVLPVLHNICVDYLPAQVQTAELGICGSLLKLLDNFEQVRSSLEYICRLLQLLLVQPYCQENDDESAVLTLCSLITRNDDDARIRRRHEVLQLAEYISLSTTITSYLQHPRFQEYLIAHETGISPVLEILEYSYAQYNPISPEEISSLENAQKNLTSLLSDSSALSTFTERYKPVSPFSHRMHSWLLSLHLQMQISACITLGNIGRSDDACIELVQTLHIHLPLLQQLRLAKAPSLIYSLLSLLKNLALPKSNKTVLGAASTGCFETLETFWERDVQPQMQYLSLSISRILCTGCSDNILFICGSRSNGLDELSKTRNETRLAGLKTLFHRVDDKPSKMEIARLYTIFVRFFATLSSTNTTSFLRAEVTEHQALSDEASNFWADTSMIVDITTYMLSQEEWPAIRSEAWFILGLLARYTSGKEIVVKILDDGKVLRLLDLGIGGGSGSGTVKNEELEEDTTVDNNSTNTSNNDNKANKIETTPNEPWLTDKAIPSPQAKVDLENILVMLTEILNASEETGAEILTKEKRVQLDAFRTKGGQRLVELKVMGL